LSQAAEQTHGSQGPFHLQSKPAPQPHRGASLRQLAWHRDDICRPEPRRGNPVTPELVQWADIIFVMERTHRSKLSAKFKAHLGNAHVVCLEIPDDYEFMDPYLIRLLKVEVPRHLPSL
jgi:protein-tyrosine-phosphatase